MLRPILAACLLLLAPGTALAQPQMLGPMDYLAPQIMFENHVRQQQAGREEARRATTQPSRPQAAPADAAALTYTVDPARRRANLAGFVAKTRASDPAGADNLAQLFASADIFAAIQTEGDKYGMRVNNLADAYAAYWINAWQASQGQTHDPSRAAMTAVRAQAGRALLDSGGLAGANNAAKQEMAESLWIQAMLAASAAQAAQGKPADQRAVASAVAQGAQGMGLDLSAVRLTDQGFVPRQ